MQRANMVESARSQHQRTRLAPSRPPLKPPEEEAARGDEPSAQQPVAAAASCHSPAFEWGITAETWSAVHGVAVRQRRFGPWRYKPKDPKALLPSKGDEKEKVFQKEALHVEPSYELPPRDFTRSYAAHFKPWSEPGINTAAVEKLLMSPPNVAPTDPFAMAEARKGTRAERVSLSGLLQFAGA